VMSSSTVTYASVYTDSDPWRFQWASDEEPEAPPSPDYVPGPEHPPSPNYVPGPEEPEQAPLSPDYVPEPEYPEYLVPSDAEAPIEDQPLPDDASPTALSPGYIADSDPEEIPLLSFKSFIFHIFCLINSNIIPNKEDPKEDLEEDSADYPADGGDDDDESSDDDDEQEASKDDDEEEEHPAPVDSSAIPVDDHVPSAEDTKAFKTNESAPTPVPSPRLRTDKMAAEIRLSAASPPIHHPSEIPSPPLLLPSTSHRDDLPKADMSF
ncbi:hypothetical protein Tco_0930617, partial [Tanacetum coccineum]